MRFLLDTTAFSALMKREEGLCAILQAHPPGDFVTAPPVVAEVAYGVCRVKPGSRKRLLLTAAKDAVLSVLTVVPWTPEASERFGHIKAALEKTGYVIEDFDIAIAAIALSHECGVLTRNKAHFDRVEGLELAGW